MKPLLSPEGEAALAAICRSKTLFAFDYDGTLAPIVADPKAAHLPHSTAAALAQLSGLAKTAIITGRAQADVLRLVARGSVDFVVGNHGLEGLPGDNPYLDAATNACAEWSRKLQSLRQLPGVLLEDKQLSLTVHYRGAADHKLALALVLEAVATLEPQPKVMLGKCVVNLVAKGVPDKGTAVQHLVKHSGCDAAVFFGDDDNDDDAFRLQGPKLLAVCIGQRTDLSAAYYVEDPLALAELLPRICSILQAAGHKHR